MIAKKRAANRKKWTKKISNMSKKQRPKPVKPKKVKKDRKIAKKSAPGAAITDGYKKKNMEKLKKAADEIKKEAKKNGKKVPKKLSKTSQIAAQAKKGSSKTTKGKRL